MDVNFKCTKLFVATASVMDPATFYSYPSIKYHHSNYSSEAHVWPTGTNRPSTVVYSMVVPIICLFGIIGNSVSLKVLCREELNGSVFIYLSVLAFSDLFSCVLLFISGLSCGVLYPESWPAYDGLLGLPFSGIFNNLSVLTIVLVTVDRLIFLRKPLVCKRPKFCESSVARRLAICSFLISILFNISNCFLFEIGEDGHLIPSRFYYSRLLTTLNWIKFLLFTIVPSVFLIIGHGFLIYYLRKLKRIIAECPQAGKCLKQKGSYGTLVTVLVLMVLFFLVSQIPTMLTSRSISEIFFHQQQLSESEMQDIEAMETARQISTVLYAINLAADFILYYLFCPDFCKVFVKIWNGKGSSKRPEMNVFILGSRVKECDQSVETFIKAKVASNREFLRDSSTLEQYQKSFNEKNNVLITISSNFPYNAVY